MRTSVGGDPALRLYRIGPYGGLIGTSVAGRPAGPAQRARRSVRDASKFDAVEPTAHYIPWTWIAGDLTGVAPGRTVAVAVDGVIAGTSVAIRDPQGVVGYWGLLVPQYFRLGPNQVGLYLVGGPATAPTLTPIPAT